MAQTISPTKQSKRSIRLASAFALGAVLYLGGCRLPATPQVSIDWSKIPDESQSVSVDLPSPLVSQVPSNLQTRLESKPRRMIREKEGEELWRRARATLAENRRRSLKQLREDLERRYLGDARSRIIALQEQNRDLDDQDWEQTLEKFRAQFEEYANAKAPLAVELAGFIGFPDRGQSVPRRRTEDFYREYRRAQVQELREAIDSLDKQFTATASQILAAYSERSANRSVDLQESAQRSDAEARARAERDAQAAVQKVIGAFDESLPELAKNLEPLPAEQVESSMVRPLRPQWDPARYQQGVPRSKVKEYANVFVKSRGWNLVPSGGRDVTEEFLTWLKTNGPGL